MNGFAVFTRVASGRISRRLSKPRTISIAATVSSIDSPTRGVKVSLYAIMAPPTMNNVSE